jgi:hypothetical protein
MPLSEAQRERLYFELCEWFMNHGTITLEYCSNAAAQIADEIDSTEGVTE